MTREESKVIPPEPMTPEMRSRFGQRTLDDERFMYGDWAGSWQYYHKIWPGFSEDQCKTLELYSRGMRSKEYKQLIKKDKRKCSQSKRKAG